MTTETKPENGNQLTTQSTERIVAMVTDDGPFAYLLDTAKFNHCWRIANAFSKSQLVPDAFKNNPENCFVAIQASIRMGCDPFMFLQNCYVIHGKPSIEAKLAIALLNQSGKIVGSIGYELNGSGMTRSCTAHVTDAVTAKRIEFVITMEDAKKEGWIDKKDSKWKTIPDLMLRYRSAAWLIKTHYPEVLMGMHTRDELEDVTIETVDQPALPKRIREIKLSEQPTSHITTSDWRSIPGLPDEVGAEFEQSKDEASLKDAFTWGLKKFAGDELQEAAVQTAYDGRLQELRGKVQKELV